MQYISDFTFIKKIFKAILISFIAYINLGHAVPTSSNLYVDYIRVYSNGTVYIGVTTADFCSTSVFSIPSTTIAKKEFLASLLSAQAANKPVWLEAVNSTGCTGWGTAIESVWLRSQ